jgi:hypothetical protein
MTDIAPAQIPSTALPATNGTLEVLAFWALLTLKAANGTKGAVEVSGTESQDVVQYQIFQQPDGTYRALGRFNLPLNENYITDQTAPIWTFAEELTSGSPPANYVV